MFNAAIRTSCQNASAFGALFGAAYDWLVWIFLSVLKLYQKFYLTDTKIFKPKLYQEWQKCLENTENGRPVQRPMLWGAKVSFSSLAKL